MRTGMSALVAGLLLLRLLPALPPVWLLWLLPILGLMLLPFRSYPLAFFLFGLSWAGISAQSALDDRLAPQLDGRTLWLQGQVVGLPDRGAGVVRFQLQQAESPLFHRPPGLAQRGVEQLHPRARHHHH